MASTADRDLRISAEKAKAMVDRGEAVIVDVVASSVYPMMHEAISGAIRIAPEDLPDRTGELPRDKTILTYCT